MIEVDQYEIDDKFQRVFQLNPFDAVVLVDFEHSQRIIANDRAYSMFQPVHNKSIVATSFFGEELWQQLEGMESNTEKQVYSKLQMIEQATVNKQIIKIEDTRYGLFIIRVVPEKITEHFELSRYLYHDELTTLYNRRALNEHWSSIYEKKENMDVALILVDLDRFKRFNESLGKKKADSMLTIISERFKMLCSDLIKVYRYNGDEFVFIIHYLSREAIENLASAIFNVMNESIDVDGQEYFITLSVGIAVSTNTQKIALEEMLERADQAVFSVKQHGRNHYRFYENEMTQVFPNDALMESHLRKAIEFNELSVHFQPQIDLATQKINSFEALLRWNNRKFGQVPPSQFIPLAESSGIMLEIGDWVLEQVCIYLNKWNEKGYRKVRVAINISPTQFKQDRFVQKIKDLIVRYAIDPNCLELEITESSMSNVEETTEILKEIKAIGVYISVDDFGTGYSSLSYLKTYPIDILKIDQSFIADIQKDKKNEAIIKAIISMSRNLGLEVIAEGVEEQYQEQFLMAHHCQKVQGFLYDKPLTVENIEKQYLAV